MKASGPSSLLPWIVHRGDWKGLRQAFSPLWSYSPAERTYVSGIKKARLRRRLWPSVGGRLYRRVAEKRFLRWMGPWGPWVRKFDGAFSPEGCGLPLDTPSV